jgi:hypothetical protein
MSANFKKMMDEEIPCDWIDRYNDDDLDENEKALFQKRMLADPLLHSEVQIDASLNRFLLDPDAIDLMGKIRDISIKNRGSNSLRKSILLAASVLVLAMAGGMVYLAEKTNMSTSLETARQSRKIVKKQLVLPENPGDAMPPSEMTHRCLPEPGFQPFAEFELLTGSVTRSSLVKLISPEVKLSIPRGTMVLFSWRYYDSIVPVSIIILNNRGIQLSQMQLCHGTRYILKTNGFREGLYYWKIMADDDLVLMGKMIIL